MNNQGLFKKFRIFLFLWLFLFPLTLHATFIEATIGTAIVPDATATVYNPASLIVLKNPQLVALGSVANFRTQFTGQAIQTATGFTQSGNANTKTHYFLPGFYSGIPIKDRVTIGFAIVSNSFNKDMEDNSILRYAQSSNSIRGVDFVPAIGIKLNECFSLGAGFNFSSAKFILHPVTGLPSLNIPDSESNNECDGHGVGGDVGFLLKPSSSTTIGFNYRSAIKYKLSGKSVLNGITTVTSNHYGFTIWTPARIVLSVNQFATPCLGFIGTIQRIQTSIIKNIKIHGIATRFGLLNASAPFHLHDSWLLTVGTHYRINPKWIVRVAGSYIQSPDNNHFQIANGDTFILGASMGFALNKHFVIDGSYAHAFIQNEKIHIATNRVIVNGENKGSRDAVSLKLTVNI